MNALEGKSDWFEECKHKFWKTFGADCCYWLPVQALNFTYIPSDLRVAFVAIATFVNWTGNLAVGLIFPQMQAKIQTYSFLPFTIILIILLVILFMYLPETKGIAVHEIEALFQVKISQVSDSRPYLRPLLSQVPNAWKRSIGRSDKILLEEIRQQQQNQGKINYGATANNFEEM